MVLKEKQKQNPTGGGNKEFDFYLDVRNMGQDFKIGVKKGDRLKDVLARAKIGLVAGLLVKLNNHLLKLDPETYELLDNPLLAEGDYLVMEKAFQGGH